VIDIEISRSTLTGTASRGRFGSETFSSEEIPREGTRGTRLLSSMRDAILGVVFSDKLRKFQFPDIPEVSVVEGGNFHGAESKVEWINKVQTRVNYSRYPLLINYRDYR